MNRAIAQNLAALLIGVLISVAVATALNLATQAAKRESLDTQSELVADAARVSLARLLAAAERAGPTPEAIAARDDAQNLAWARRIDAAAPAFEVLGLAIWRRGADGPTLETALETATRQVAFVRAVDASLRELDRAYEATTRPRPTQNAIVELSLRRSAALASDPATTRPRVLPDPSPFATPTFWIVWLAADGAQVVGLRIALSPETAMTPITGAGGLPDATLAVAVEPKAGRSGLTTAFSLLPNRLTARRVVQVDDVAFTLVVERASGGFGALLAPHLPPALTIGALIGLATFLLMRGERRRTDATIRENDSVMRSMEAKQRELDASEARFRRLAESTNVVPWAANLDTQRFVYVGPQVEDFSGYPATTWYANGFWTHHIHPDDRRRVLVEEISKIPPGAYHTIEYRIRASNGRILHLRNMLTITRKPQNSDGRPVTIAEGFLLDVTEMKRAEATLEEARKKAEDANRVKSEFLANMSHELRTPLNAVIGFSEIMKDEVFGALNPQYREYAESIHQSGRHLLDLINDVLDLSKIEAGRIELAEEEADLRELTRNCVKLLQERIASAGLVEKVDIEERMPTMVVDERRIKQVLLNLISNAAKFTPPGGQITIRAGRAQEGGVELAVRDTGVGMSAEEIPRALSKFGQIDGELARKHDGTGLGLPIAKSLIELHGGALTIASEKGKGTEVRIWLPPDRFVTSAA